MSKLSTAKKYGVWFLRFLGVVAVFDWIIIPLIQGTPLGP